MEDWKEYKVGDVCQRLKSGKKYRLQIARKKNFLASFLHKSRTRFNHTPEAFLAFSAN